MRQRDTSRRNHITDKYPLCRSLFHNRTSAFRDIAYKRSRNEECSEHVVEVSHAAAANPAESLAQGSRVPEISCNL
jgi:hypothetical protein